MLSFILIIILTFLLIGFGIYEYRTHQEYISTIPVRIHINGTRGKSSVTRLIGAGLRAGGIHAITKVTGTYPRLILEDGSETEIYRKEKANIIEQLGIVKFAAKRKVDALVIECMALQPRYQYITEHHMIHATVGVITNIRLDHLDVMGPQLEDVAKALSNTVPANQHLFTSDSRNQSYLKSVAEKRNTNFHLSVPESVKDDEMVGFNYIEHKENVALALDVCNHFGIDREAALKEMKKMIPDEGVLTRQRVYHSGNKIDFYNAFAANDPESTLMLWKSIMVYHKTDEKKIALLTTRKDRLDRARQMLSLLSTKLDFDLVIFIGDAPKLIESLATKHKLDKDKYLIPNWNTGEEVFNGIVNLNYSGSVVVGIGNMVGIGAEVVKCFMKNNSNNK